MSRFETKVPPFIWWLWGLLITFYVSATFGDSLLDAGWARVVAFVLLFAGFGIAFAAIAKFRSAKTTSDPRDISRAENLVTDGVYQFTRNPMYLGLLLVLVGWGFWTGTILGALIGPAFFVLIMTRLQIGPEERLLAEKFGDEYAAFAEQTRRWI